ncbi:NADP-dependent oxidoreductase [Paenibacillus guangzhouensis]|uniref:NADP-dependent oxidoreductase n=1 Tax=Paenibacillus guangzhouensis TaxID=1473112 RepID=UPI001266FC3D
MKAIGITEFGAPEVLQVMNVEIVPPGSGEVRVKVKAAGVQPVDAAVRKGFSPPGTVVTVGTIPGNEFAGIIDQIGEGVSQFQVGDEVLGFRLLGSYADYVIVSEEQIVHKPSRMPWEVAGGLSGAGQTAVTALELLDVSQGDTVLINGAAGAVGTIAVQVARAFGASVIGTASEANQEYLLSLGAIPVIYGEGLSERLRALAPEGIHAAVDAAGGDGLRVACEFVLDKSRVGTIVAFDVASELGIRAIRSQRSKARLAKLIDLYDAGKLSIHIREAFPMERAADAHTVVEKGHGRGKVVLVMM